MAQNNLLGSLMYIDVEIKNSKPFNRKNFELQSQSNFVRHCTNPVPRILRLLGQRFGREERLSPGDQTADQGPEDPGYEIAITQTRCLDEPANTQQRLRCDARYSARNTPRSMFTLLTWFEGPVYFLREAWMGLFTFPWNVM